MSKTHYYTKAGLEKIRAELHQMKTEGRRNIAAAIAEAREKGDLKENAEYDAAKEDQGMHEAKVAELENILANARVIDDSMLDDSSVHILSTVTVKNLGNNMEMKYTLVSATEANFKESKISVDSPVAKGLLGKAVGDIAEIKVPAGLMKFEVLNIKTDL